MRRIAGKAKAGMAVLFSFLLYSPAYGLMLDSNFIMPETALNLAKAQEPVLEPQVFLNEEVTPPLDISGIAEIQKISIGGSEMYDKENSIRILESIANLAVMQFDVEEHIIVVTNQESGEQVSIPGGEFGRILREELLKFNPKREMLGVIHTELVQTPGLTPEFDEDHFELDINGRWIELVLARDMGRPDKGFPEWGMRGLKLQQFVKDSGNPPQTEELDLVLDVLKGEGWAGFTKRLYAPDGTLLKWETWVFEAGNPDPIDYKSGTGEE